MFKDYYIDYAVTKIKKAVIAYSFIVILHKILDENSFPYLWNSDYKLTLFESLCGLPVLLINLIEI